VPDQKKLTPRQVAALKILKENPRIRAKEFAEHFWPEAIMHQACSNQGNGACRGKKAWLCAGSYLGKLSRAGLVQAENTGTNSYSRVVYSITRIGSELLQRQNGKA